jgi:membrane peptidoglycan carboxypeptidase
VVALVGMLLGFGIVGVLYARTDVPDPEALPTNQIATVYYSDGKTTLARIGSQNRSDVPLTQVPVYVRDAVLAAENRSFYSDPGISPKGIARAAWNNVRGGDLQGGSTITQQYVKNAFTSGDRTFSRKFKELFVTVKLDRQYSKDQILEWYLNTIYFGRGAYGIQAAAGVYFGKTVDKLTAVEGAVLASSIRSPALYDPEAHPEAARDRWKFVLNGMVTMGKLTDTDVARAKYPKVRLKSAAGNLDAASKTWAGHVVDRVKDELGSAGFDEARLNAEGLRVVTTLNAQAQRSAVKAVDSTFSDQKQNPPFRQALVALEPRSGKVLAYYGGANGNGTDYAWQAWRQPGSSFKPIVLATALQHTLSAETPDDEKVSVYKTYDGSSPRTFPGLTKPVRNSDNAQCNPCTVLEAMKRSINTVFYQMAVDVGPNNVATIAHALGVPEKRQNGTPTLQQRGATGGGIGIGQYEVRPIDQATSFGTIAAGGELHPTHFVDKVLDRNGNIVYEHKDNAKRAIDPKVANDVTYAMKPVAEYSHDTLADGRESAAKTGTQQYPSEINENQDAWMVGFTPQVSAAVWVGKDNPAPLRTNSGKRVYGSGLPGITWRKFMDGFLAGRDEMRLTDDVQVNPQMKPTPTPTPTPSEPSRTPDKPTPRPTIAPSPSGTPTPTPTPTPTESVPPTSTPTTSPSPTKSGRPFPPLPTP